MIVDAAVFEIGEKLGFGIFEIALFRANSMGIDGVDFVGVGARGAPSEGCRRFTLPTADFDDHAVALVELPQSKQAFHFRAGEHAGQLTNVFKSMQSRLPCLYH